MVSMKDIARRCGVSVATVSKALRDQKDIGAETKAQIRAVAEELGYMTNSAARALKTNRTYNIGVLFVDEQESGLNHEFFSAMLNSLKDEAESCGYDVTFINRNVGKRSTSYLQHCRYRAVDGVIIACVDFTDPQVLDLVNSEIPVVTIDHVFDNRISVCSDNISGMETLTDFVLDQGHRCIGVIHGEGTAVTQNRLIGFYRSCERHGVEIPEAYIRYSPFHDSEGCARETEALLALEPRPTCILFPDDFSAIGGLNVIWKSGLRVPEDISTAGYDGIRLSEILHPPLTTYRQNTDGMGRCAVQRLIELIEHPKTTIPVHEIISGELVPGDSVKEPVS